MVRAIFVALLAFRLVVDMATPLLPGAYHFDAAESIDAHRPPSTSTAHIVARPAAVSRVASTELVNPSHERRVRSVPVTGGPEIQRGTPHVVPDSASEASEDH